YFLRLKPGDQPVHVCDSVGFGRPVLRRPAGELTLEIAPGLAEIAKANSCKIDVVQRGEHIVHRVINGAALIIEEVWKGRVPEDPALDKFHDVEHAPDGRGVI